MPKFKHALIAAVAIPALMLGAVACNDDADSESSASQESIDETNTRVQRNEMLWANLALQQQPLHDIDETLNDPTAEVPFNAIPTMRTVARVIFVTNWDSELKADADQIREDALAVIEALEADDREAAAEHATAVHDGQHDFNGKAWEHLAPGGAPAEEHDDSTPAAGATEPADDHSDDDATPEANSTP